MADPGFWIGCYGAGITVLKGIGPFRPPDWELPDFTMWQMTHADRGSFGALADLHDVEGLRGGRAIDGKAWFQAYAPAPAAIKNYGQ